MNATTTNPNGRTRKSLAEQIDRLDALLDGLAEGINDTVVAAVQAAVRTAVVEVLDLLHDKSGAVLPLAHDLFRRASDPACG